MTTISVDTRVESYLDVLTLEDWGDESWGEHGTYWVRDALEDHRAELLSEITSYHAGPTGQCSGCGTRTYANRGCDYCGES